MSDLPHPVLEQIRKLCISDRSPAYLLAGPDGTLLDWGGCCERYGLDDLQRGAPARDQADCLEGVLPLQGSPLFLPFVEVAPDVLADIYFMPDEKGDWVLFLDSSVEAHRLAEWQQTSNELLLLREQQTKLLAQVEREHQTLLTVFDQLQLMTAIIDASGMVAFLSEAGRRFFLKKRPPGPDLHWARAFGFSAADRDKVQTLLDAPAASRERLLVQTGSAGRRNWLEVDVRDDPADPEKRILYIYDVSEVHNLRQVLNERTHFHGIIGKSREIERVFGLIKDLAGMDTTVLIEGETGTGKELVARAIHFSSHRKDEPFITVNCAGLSDSLINSQLFGHKKGSFTDAIRDQEGVFEAAHGGTIFLDEIGDIPMNTQTRILRVLQEREIVRIGETRPRKIQIRVLAATNKDLDGEVRKGTFRLDLLYRIRVARVLLPPLRKRQEDIPLLVHSFLEEARVSTGKSVDAVQSDAMQLLMEHQWPGNVRELRNAVEFAVVRCKGAAVGAADLPPELSDKRLRTLTRRAYSVETERDRILDALERTGGNRAEAAQLLGISRATLYRRMKACQL